MTGAAHYREAERLLGQIEAVRRNGGDDAHEWLAARAAQAQVHASLALAAAQALTYALAVADGSPTSAVAHAPVVADWTKAGAV